MSKSAKILILPLDQKPNYEAFKVPACLTLLEFGYHCFLIAPNWRLETKQHLKIPYFFLRHCRIYHYWLQATSQNQLIKETSKGSNK